MLASLRAKLAGTGKKAPAPAPQAGNFQQLVGLVNQIPIRVPGVAVSEHSIIGFTNAVRYLAIFVHTGFGMSLYTIERDLNDKMRDFDKAVTTFTQRGGNPNGTLEDLLRWEQATGQYSSNNSGSQAVVKLVRILAFTYDLFRRMDEQPFTPTGEAVKWAFDQHFGSAYSMTLKGVSAKHGFFPLREVVQQSLGVVPAETRPFAGYLDQLAPVVISLQQMLQRLGLWLAVPLVATAPVSAAAVGTGQISAPPGQQAMPLRPLLTTGTAGPAPQQSPAASPYASAMQRPYGQGVPASPAAMPMASPTGTARGASAAPMGNAAVGGVAPAINPMPSTVV